MVRQRDSLWHCAFIFWRFSRQCCCPPPPLNYDTGLYHLQAVRWIESFPVVPGLGNLHYRLAYNSSEFLYVAMIDRGPGLWWGKGAHFANGLLLIVMVAQLLTCFFKARARSSAVTLRFLSGFLLLIIMPEILGHSKNVSSCTPDLPFFVLQVLISCALIRLFDYCISDKVFDAAQELVFLIILVFVGMTVRFNILVFAVMALITAVGVVLYFKQSCFTEHRRIILAGLGLGSVLLITYFVNGFILSGYLVFPIPYFAFQADWTIPHRFAVSALNGDRWWSMHGIVGLLQSQAGLFYTVLPVALFFLNIVVILILMSFRKIRIMMMAPFIFLVPSLIFIIYWFFSAPDPRFLGSAGCLLAAGTTGVVAQYGKKVVGWLTVGFLFGMLLFVIFKKDVFLVSWKKYMYGHTTAWQGVKDKETGLYMPFGIKVKKTLVSEGLSVYVPEEGDQCWDAPLPCAPFVPDSHLRLRTTGDLRDGFKIQ